MFLESIGIRPAKSLTMPKLLIPKKFFADFLRGCFDGDGSSYSYFDPRWKSSLMFYISFASSSPVFIYWLKRMVSSLWGIKGHVTRAYKKRICYQLRYSKYEAIKLVEFLYRTDKKSIKLNRKYLKIMKSLGIVHGHKGRVFVR